MDAFDEALEKQTKEIFYSGPYMAGAKWAREWIYSRHKLYEDHRVEAEKLRAENERLKAQAEKLIQSINHGALSLSHLAALIINDETSKAIVKTIAKGGLEQWEQALTNYNQWKQERDG